MHLHIPGSLNWELTVKNTFLRVKKNIYIKIHEGNIYPKITLILKSYTINQNADLISDIQIPINIQWSQQRTENHMETGKNQHVLLDINDISMNLHSISNPHYYWH